MQNLTPGAGGRRGCSALVGTTARAKGGVMMYMRWWVSLKFHACGRHDLSKLVSMIVPTHWCASWLAGPELRPPSDGMWQRLLHAVGRRGVHARGWGALLLKHMKGASKPITSALVLTDCPSKPDPSRQASPTA